MFYFIKCKTIFYILVAIVLFYLKKKISNIYHLLNDDGASGSGPGPGHNGNKPDQPNTSTNKEVTVTKENIQDMIKELTKFSGKNKSINTAGISDLTRSRLETLKKVDHNILGKTLGATKIDNILIKKLTGILKAFK